MLIQQETVYEPLDPDYSFRNVIIGYLLNQLDSPFSSSWALLFIQKECMDFIQYKEKIKLLKLCLQLRSTIGYDDLEQNQVLYNIQKDLHLPSCAWKEEILVNCQDKQRLYECDILLERIIQAPNHSLTLTNEWLKLIPDNKHIPSSIQTRLKLHGATYPLEMKQFNRSLTSKGYCLPTVSPDLLHLLTRISLSCPLLELPSQVDDMAAIILGQSQWTNISLDDALVKNIRSSLGVHDQYDGLLLEECALMLKDTPARCMPHLTLSMIMMTSTRLTLGLPFWVQAIAQRVDETVYLNSLDDPSVMDLVQLVLYFVGFCQCSDFPFGTSSCDSSLSSNKAEFQRIWHHYELQRSLYSPILSYDIISPLIKALLSLCYQYLDPM
ncbi:unnamed protein product [Absidia cylindrospora]